MQIFNRFYLEKNMKFVNQKFFVNARKCISKNEGSVTHDVEKVIDNREGREWFMGKRCRSLSGVEGNTSRLVSTSLNERISLIG